MAERQRFRATVERVGMNYCVLTTPAVSRALGPGAALQVRGRAGGAPLRTRAMPTRDGRHRIFLDGPLRAAAGVGAGDRVALELEPAGARPAPPLSADLRGALRALPGGVDAFARLTETQRRAMVEFVERARTPATRARYVERIVAEVAKRTGQPTGERR